MDNSARFMSLVTATNSPFIVQMGIKKLIEESENDAAKFRYLKPEMADNIKSMWRSHDALYGVCSVDVDLAYSKELRKSGWWARRKLKKIEQQWKTGMWLTFTIEAEQFIKNMGNHDLHNKDLYRSTQASS